MGVKRRHAVLIGIVPALSFAVLLSLPKVKLKLKAEEVPLRNNGHRDIRLRLESVVDVINRPKGQNEIMLHPHPVPNSSDSYLDSERRATLAFTFSGAEPGKRAPMIFVETADGEYLRTKYGEPVDGSFSGAAYLSVHPDESFYLVAREGSDEVGRWRISGLTSSYDEATRKDFNPGPPPASDNTGFTVNYGSSPPANPSVKCTLEEVIRPVADGYTRSYNIRYSFSKKQPNQTLESVRLSTGCSDYFCGFSMGDRGTLPFAYPSDRNRYISIYGREVTLPGDPVPIHFHRLGANHWVANIGPNKMLINKPAAGSQPVVYEGDEALEGMFMMYRGQEFRPVHTTHGALYWKLPDSDFTVDGFQFSGSNVELFQFFKNVLDTQHPDIVTHAKRQMDLSGGKQHLETMMYVAGNN